MKIIDKILLFILIIIIPINIYALELPDLYSKNVLLYDIENDKLLYERNGDQIISIASLTKVMTTIVAIENIEDLNDTITITKEMLDEIPWDASVAGLKEGDIVTYRDLLYASLLPSGADATTALAYGICGSSSKFIELMNNKAKELGLNHTHFANVTGYDIDNHYSTPKEVLKYLTYALNNSLFNEIYRTKSYTLSNGLLVLSTVYKAADKWNYDLSSVLGSKTGYTDNAGLCMSAIIDINGKELLLLTFGAEVNKERTYHLEDTLKVINYLKDNYKAYTLYKKGDILLTIPVNESTIKNYDIKVSRDIIVNSIDEVSKEDYYYEYDGLDNLSFRNKKGDKIGTIKFYYEDDVILQNVFLDQNINISLFKFFKSNYLLLLPFIIVILLSLYVFNYKSKRKKRRRKKGMLENK